MWVATWRHINFIHADRFQSPCGCELQRWRYINLIYTDRFQSPCGCELQQKQIETAIMWYLFQSPCGCELQPTSDKLQNAKLVSIPLRVWVATNDEIKLPKKYDLFQSPCGCELQPVTFFNGYWGIGFQSPCGCELQRCKKDLAHSIQSFNPLAGVSCNGSISCRLPRILSVSIPLRVWVATTISPGG